MKERELKLVLNGPNWTYSRFGGLTTPQCRFLMFFHVELCKIGVVEPSICT